MVITVWIFGYLSQTAMGNLDALADPSHFGSFINSYTVFGYMAVVVVIVNLILLGGVKQGIEKAAKFLMPALFVMLLALVAYVLTLDNAMAGVKYYIIPDFSKMSASVLNGALSQAFFLIVVRYGYFNDVCILHI